MQRPLLIVSAGFVLSRLLLWTTGLRTEGMGDLDSLVQFIDPGLLQHDLLRSLYFSSFPPLFNLFLGAMLKLFGPSPLAFGAVYFALGWAMSLLLCSLMMDLGVRSRLAVAAALAFMLLPPAILYEHWVFYSYFEAALLLAVAWSFNRFWRRPTVGLGTILFAAASALALLNARYGLYLLVLAALLHLAVRRREDFAAVRITALKSAWPVLVVVFAMAKNAWLFGVAAVDPHFGFYVAPSFTLAAEVDPVLHDYFRREQPLLLVSTLSFPFPEEGNPLRPAPTGVPVLDEPKRSGGAPNFCNVYYLDVSRLYDEEVRKFVLNQPALYLRFCADAFHYYCLPSNLIPYLNRDNRRVLGAYDSLYITLHPALLALQAAGVLYALAAIVRRKNRDPNAPTLALLVLSVGWALLTIFIAFENNRYKFSTEPLAWALIVYAAQKIFDALRAKSRPSSIPSPA